MDQAIIAGFITGIFGIGCCFLTHYLTKKRYDKNEPTNTKSEMIIKYLGADGLSFEERQR